MNENRDWPASLRLSAARDQLAQVIYMARAQAYGIGSPHWEGLSPAIRDSYRDIALDVLKKLKPEPRIDVDYFSMASEGAMQFAVRAKRRPFTIVGVAVSSAVPVTLTEGDAE